jgi:hypothetical protein
VRPRESQSVSSVTRGSDVNGELTKLLADDVGALLAAEKSRAVGVGTCEGSSMSRDDLKSILDDIPRLSGQSERLQM